MPKRTRTAIPDSEWVITAQLVQGDSQKIGPPIEMHFADSYVCKAAAVGNMEFLISRRLEEAIPALKRDAAKKKKEKKV